MKFPEILKKLRSQDEINQSQLAQAIGVSRSAVGMYESGKREPDFETMEAIADYFNVTMDYLLGKTTNSKITTIADNSEANKNTITDTSDEALMFALYGDDNKDITPELLDEIRAFAKFARERKKDNK